jgi:hypothetical protein
MTSAVTRLYVLVVGVLVFFVAWAGVVAHPWAPTAAPSAAPAVTLVQPRAANGKLAPVKVVKLPALTVTRVS